MIQFLIAEFPPEWRDLDPETFWSRVIPLLRIEGETRPIPHGTEWVPLHCDCYDNMVVVVAEFKKTDTQMKG